MAEKNERKEGGGGGQEDNKETRKPAGVISLNVFIKK